MPPLTRSTRLGELPPSVLFKLRSFFDPEYKWKDLAAVILNRQGEEKYTPHDISNFELELQKGKSPTEALIHDWSHDYVPVQNLLRALAEIMRYDVLKFLLVDKMKEMSGDEFEKQVDIGWDGFFEGKPDNSTKYTPVKVKESYVRSAASPVEGSAARAVEDSVNVNETVRYDRVFDTYESGGTGGGRDVYNQNEMLTAVKEVETAVHPDRNKPDDRAENTITIRQYTYNELSALTDNWNGQPISEGGQLLGSGGYATVYLAKPPDQRRMAVKKLQNKDNSQKQFFNEMKTLAEFVHPNIVPLFGVCQESPDLCIVYEYMENGSLEDRLECKDKTPPLTSGQRCRIAKGIAQGLNFLHTKNQTPFVHRDIKSANILLDYDFSAKIGDCGLARRGPADTGKTHTKTTTVIGTAAYCAPEYFQNEISVKIDAYSFGMVLYELLTGSAVSDGRREEPRLNEHVRKCFRIHGPESIQYLVDVKMTGWQKENMEHAFDMAYRLTAIDKLVRPKVEEVLYEILEWPQEW